MCQSKRVVGWKATPSEPKGTWACPPISSIFPARSASVPGHVRGLLPIAHSNAYFLVRGRVRGDRLFIACCSVELEAGGRNGMGCSLGHKTSFSEQMGNVTCVGPRVYHSSLHPTPLVVVVCRIQCEVFVVPKYGHHAYGHQQRAIRRCDVSDNANQIVQSVP
eukprot:gene12525-biopygen22982